MDDISGFMGLPKEFQRQLVSLNCSLSECSEQMNHFSLGRLVKVQSTKRVELKLDMISTAKCHEILMLEMSSSVREQQKRQRESQGAPVKKSRRERQL